MDVGTSHEELERLEDLNSSPISPHAFVRPENQGPDLPPLLRLLPQIWVHSGFESQGFQNSVNSLSSREPVRHGIRKILISLDVGSGNIKALWKPTFRHDRGRVLVDRLIHEKCRPVLWKNNRPDCPAQIAFKLTVNDEGGRSLEQLHGFDAKPSPGDTMSEARVLKWFKPAIFNTDDSRIVNFHDTSLQQRIERARIWAEASRIEPQSMPRLTVEALYANLLGYAYHVTQEQINEEFSGLMFRNDDAMLQWVREVEVDVALPVPANPQPRHVETALSAARIADLPAATRPVAEPAAAVVYFL